MSGQSRSSTFLILVTQHQGHHIVASCSGVSFRINKRVCYEEVDPAVTATIVYMKWWWRVEIWWFNDDEHIYDDKEMRGCRFTSLHTHEKLLLNDATIIKDVMKKAMSIVYQTI